MLEGILARPNLKEERREELENDLSCPPMPIELAYIWQAFLRLHNRRSSGFSFNPISWYELDAFLRHSQLNFAPWEVQLLEELDNIWLKEQNKKRE